jgi:hypothetical protein
MAYLGEAFDTLNNNDNNYQNIDYFFTQRNLSEDQEIIDKNMNRIFKKKKVIYNFLAINIPNITKIINNNRNYLDGNKSLINHPLGFEIEIFGDEGYHYKGEITSYYGVIPNFMIPIKKDKKLFIHINYKLTDDNQNICIKKFINFIDVPKRFQNINENDNDTETNEDKN